MLGPKIVTPLNFEDIRWEPSSYVRLTRSQFSWYASNLKDLIILRLDEAVGMNRWNFELINIVDNRYICNMDMAVISPSDWSRRSGANTHSFGVYPPDTIAFLNAVNCFGMGIKPAAFIYSCEEKSPTTADSINGGVVPDTHFQDLKTNYNLVYDIDPQPPIVDETIGTTTIADGSVDDVNVADGTIEDESDWVEKPFSPI